MMLWKKSNLKVFSGLGIAPPRQVACLNLSGDNLKLACGTMISGSLQLTDFSNLDIGKLSEDDIAAAIKAVFYKLKFTSPTVVSIIPSHFAIAKDIEVPSQDPAEIWDIINLQASRHTPYAQEEIIIDYIPVRIYKETYTKIIFLIVPLNLVRRHISILQKLNLNTDKVFFAPEAMAQVSSSIVKTQSEDAVQAVLHVDLNSSDFMCTSKGKLLYVRSIPIGSDQIQKHEGRFIDEVKKSVESYLGENVDREPEHYTITGVSLGEYQLSEVLKQSLNKAVTLVPYWEHLPLASGDLKSVLNQSNESFLDVAAGLMTFNQVKVNLIPAEVKLRKSFEKRSQDLVKTGILTMSLLGLFCVAFIGRIYVKLNYMKNLKEKYQDELKKAKDLEKDFAHMQTVKEFLKDRERPLETLLEIYNLLPGDVRLINIKYDGKGKFSVDGNARTMTTVFSFISDLENSPYFKKVESKRASKRKERDEEVVDLEIVAMLEENH